jgi:hypothetical protein
VNIFNDVAAPAFRYRSPEEDSERWADLAFRTGDVVISTRSKHGTTWVQTICALLVFQTPDLPRPLAQLSPWLDWLVTPRREILDSLEAQAHRRFIKTHTPLDGIPSRSDVTYIVVARHPLDAAVSLYHQSANLNRARIAELTGQPPSGDAARPALTDWLRSWIEADCDARENLDSLPGVMWHLRDAWSRRDAANVVLMRYEDLCADLSGEMRTLATTLGIDVPAGRWPLLVEAAGFEHMRSRAPSLVPDPAGVLKDQSAFFRKGTSGSSNEVLTPADRERYRSRLAELAPGDLIEWLHSGR